MATRLFSRKIGCTLPDVELTLTASGFAYDLSEATLVEFRYRKKGESTIETVACEVTDAVGYHALLELVPAIVDTEGRFDCQVRVVIDGEDLMFPLKGFDYFEVTENF